MCGSSQITRNVSCNQKIHHRQYFAVPPKPLVTKLFWENFKVSIRDISNKKRLIRYELLHIIMYKKELGFRH
jgi:hypothetical protein